MTMQTLNEEQESQFAMNVRLLKVTYYTLTVAVRVLLLGKT